MKKCKYLENPIDTLKVDESILDILLNNNVFKIKDLWELNRANLKDMDLTDNQIKLISIKMQLLGIDINKKRY